VDFDGRSDDFFTQLICGLEVWMHGEVLILEQKGTKGTEGNRREQKGTKDERNANGASRHRVSGSSESSSAESAGSDAPKPRWRRPWRKSHPTPASCRKTCFFNGMLARVWPFCGEAGSVRVVEAEARRQLDTGVILAEVQRRPRRSWRSPKGRRWTFSTPRYAPGGDRSSTRYSARGNPGGQPAGKWPNSRLAPGMHGRGPNRRDDGG